MNPCLSAALEYAAQGLSVLPLHTIIGHRCTCGGCAGVPMGLSGHTEVITDGRRTGKCACGKDICPGKHPRIRNGVKGASLDPMVIADWWEQWPSASVGIATGAPSGGLWVLDIDTHAPAGGGLTGPEAVALLEDQHGRLPLTDWATTGSGGAHLWWRMPPGRELPRNRVALSVQGQACGIDVRSSGGYVVAPPSGHYSGGSYVWERREIVAGAPLWLCDLVAPVEVPREARPAPAVPMGADLSREQLYARRALERAVKEISGLASGVGGGGRHQALLKAARSLGGFARLLDEGEASRLLVGAALACGLGEGEAVRTVRDGWAHGAREPLPVPDRPAPTSSAWDRPDLDALASGAANSEVEPGIPHLRLVPPSERWADMPDEGEPMRPVVDRARRPVDDQVEEVLRSGASPSSPNPSVTNSPPNSPPMPPAGPVEERERPEIVVSGKQLREQVDAAWRAVLVEEGLYQRDGRVVRVQASEHGARIEEVGEGAMSERLTRAADWYSLRPPRKGEITQEGMVRQPLGAIPRPVVQAMLAVPSPRLPVLDGIVMSPVLDAQGELVGTPGYHPGARLWYAGAPMRRSRPTTQAAVDLLLGEWLGDFAFASQADRAAALGFLVQLVMRRMIGAACPLHVVEAPVQGSGKDLLVQALATVGLGGVPVVQAWAASPEERQKRLMASMLGGAPLIWIGNVTGRLADPTLAAVLTAHPVYEDRVLGGSTMGRVTVQGLSMVCTVNNATMDDDIATRAVRIRIDTGLEDPTVGRVFRHRDLIAWTAAHRDELLSAVLSLIESARADGSEWTGTVHGRYPTWSRVVGAVVEAAGLGEHWLAHRAESRGLGSPEAQEWAALVEAWAIRGGQGSTAGELATYCAAHDLLLGVMGEGKLAARGLARGLNGLRDRIWTVNGVRWRLERASMVQGRSSYALECLDLEGVPDMRARQRRLWTDDRPMFETRQDGL